jgi:hypothetical protein
MGPSSESAAAVPAEPLMQALANASCSATACHGGPATASFANAPDADAWKSAASQWLARDPHAHTAEVLSGAAASRIMGRLRAHQPDRWAAQALEEPRCLACHTNPALASVSDPAPLRQDHLRAEGVGCEACHGNASGWVYRHTTWTARDRAKGYETHGMTKLYDIGERALVCAGCHVGAPPDPDRGYPLRDVNHDMIAAGHPRLNFDFADAQWRLPPHWSEKDRTQDACPPCGPEVEMKGWLIGRVASAEAACRLLADRAGRRTRKEKTPWPELAEFNCFACHHEVRPHGVRNNSTHAEDRVPGSLRWQTIWPVTRPEPMAALAQADQLADLVEQTERHLTDLRTLLQGAGRAPPGRVRDQAAAAVSTLGELRRAIQALPDRAAARLVLGLYEVVADEPRDWDEACQIVHGLAAMERTRLRLAAPERPGFNARFAPVFGHLTLPRLPTGISYTSPHGYDPAWLNRELRQLLVSVRSACESVVK